MRFTILILLLLAAAVPSPTRLVAQEDDGFEEIFDSYLGRNAEGYLGPLAEILGASLNSGLVGSARIPSGFHVRVGVVAAASFISEGQRTFSATTEEGFYPETTMSAPTVVGSAEPRVVRGSEGMAFVFPGGLSIDRLAVGVPQLTIGSVLGTEATVRWLGYEVEEFGELSLLGVGGRHSISQHLGDPPVDLAIGAFYHGLTFSNIVDVTAFLVTLQASRTRGIFTVYGAAGYQDSAMTVSYDSEREGERVTLDLDGVGGVRGTLGVGIDLLFVHLYGDISVGSQTVVTLGLGLGN